MTGEPWVPDPEARPDYGATAGDGEQVCECGHPDWQHTKPEGEHGDCLHKSLSDRGPDYGYEFDCGCLTFRPKEVS